MRKVNKQAVLFLSRLKASHPMMETIYKRGSCFRLYEVLRTLYPQAVPYWHWGKGHVYTEIDGILYDINGPHLHKQRGAVTRMDLQCRYQHGQAPHRWHPIELVEVPMKPVEL